MSEPRDEIAEVLAAHWTAGMAPNGAAHQWECICGQPLEMSDEAHIQHLATVLAERDRRVAGAALREHADRIDRAHGQNHAGRCKCYVVAGYLRSSADRIERGQ